MHKATVNSQLRRFHYNTETKTTFHVFQECSATKILWNQLLLFFETDLDFPDFTAQAALFGFVN